MEEIKFYDSILCKQQINTIHNLGQYQHFKVQFRYPNFYKNDSQKRLYITINYINDAILPIIQVKFINCIDLINIYVIKDDKQLYNGQFNFMDTIQDDFITWLIKFMDDEKENYIIDYISASNDNKNIYIKIKHINELWTYY